MIPVRWMLRYNIKFFKLYHSLGVIPFKVDQDGLSMWDKASISRKARQWIHISLIIFWALFVALRFLQVTVLEKSSGNIWMVLIHAIFLAGSSSMAIWNFHLFWRCPDVANKVYNELVQSVQKENIGKMGIQEWVIAFLPLAFMVIQVEMTGMYLLIPRHPQYLLSLIPADYSIVIKLICIIYDLYALTSAMATGHYGVIAQLLYMQTRKVELQAALGSLREHGAPTGVQLMKHVRICRRMKLCDTFYNQVYALPAYVYKLVCLLISILGSFGCMKLHENHPLLAAICGYLSLAVTLVYISLYDGGFKLPHLFEDYKASILLLLLQKSKVGANVRSKMIQAYVRSIGTIEIRMGEFHGLERSSTLLFLHFSLANTCSLILAFPGSI